ncbi:MAG: hypothetical protein ACI4NN_05125 [Pyramidobacter sp.]
MSGLAPLSPQKGTPLKICSSMGACIQKHFVSRKSASVGEKYQLLTIILIPIAAVLRAVIVFQG